MVKRAVFGLVMGVVVVLAAGCAPPPPRAPEPKRVATVFDGEAVDVAIDWDTTPPAASTIGRPAAIALTASDGSGLRLVGVDARAVLHGPIAFTELHLSFDNPDVATREGSFSIVLPETAAVSRFAMRIGEAWQEGEVVARDAARTAYEEVVHRKVDPALLTKDPGNVFRGRVFPILPRERKEIVVSWSEELAGRDQPYRLALRGLGSIENVVVQLLVPSAKKAFVLNRRTWQPDRDFVYQPPRDAPRAVRAGELAIVRPEENAADDERGTGQTAAPPFGPLAVLVQSSARTRRSYADTVARVVKVVERLEPSSMQIAAFDQEVAPATSFDEVARRRPRGALDLRAALRWLASSNAKRVLFVSDGIATAGPADAGEIAVQAAGLHAAGIERVDVLTAGPVHDEETLHAITHAPLAKPGAVVDLSSMEPGAIAAELRRSTPRSRSLTYLTNAPPDLPADSAPRFLVERAFAKHTIATLERKRNLPGLAETERERLRKEIVELSVRQRVLTPFTSMLVLETDRDYERLGIPRGAAKNVLVVGSRGVELVPRGAIPFVPRPPSTPPAGSAIDADPTRDSDNDGIPDANDKCPDEPETYNGFQDDDGCPDTLRVIVESQSIIILQYVHFQKNGLTVSNESALVLDELARIMKEYPRIDLVAIDGHTDGLGREADNVAISMARARAVLAELVKRGVDSRRLVPRGQGSQRPIESNATEEGRAKNRRVEFRILVKDGVPTGVDDLPKGYVPPPPPPVNVRSPFASGPKKEPSGAPFDAPMLEIDQLLAHGDHEVALDKAEAWASSAPDDLLAAVAEGRALAALGRHAEAARAFGSLLDLATKPEHRRAAAGFLESIAKGHPPAMELALESYARVVRERPEQPSSHYLLAHGQARDGRLEDAIQTLLIALSHDFDRTRYPSAAEALKSELALFAAAAARGKAPADREAIVAKVKRHVSELPTKPSTTLGLTWETDESDLDLRLIDDKMLRKTAVPDLRNGFGPETIELGPSDTWARAARVEVHQVVRGPTGFAIGKVGVTRHDGAGGLVFEDRPFVVVTNGASALLGELR
ncbi:MAG: OmpA family protein [Deltaproteobacteria bacterium]|nr:OmpA family protein [Deltaproteobacteria bacterium]